MRLALETGIDRTSTIERTMSNTASEANSPLMPGSWAYLSDLQWPAYNPDQARQLLATAVDRLDRLNGSDEAAADRRTERRAVQLHDPHAERSGAGQPRPERLRLSGRS